MDEYMTDWDGDGGGGFASQPSSAITALAVLVTGIVEELEETFGAKRTTVPSDVEDDWEGILMTPSTGLSDPNSRVRRGLRSILRPKPTYVISRRNGHFHDRQDGGDNLLSPFLPPVFQGREGNMQLVMTLGFLVAASIVGNLLLLSIRQMELCDFLQQAANMRFNTTGLATTISDADTLLGMLQTAAASNSCP